MRVIKNMKCPKCKKPIPYRTLKLTEGRCNNCGYIIASSILKFANNNLKKISQPLLKDSV